MRALAAFTAGAALVIAGCGTSGPALPQITVSSPAFVNGKRIPRRYTCDGKDISLPVRWTGVPGRARQLTVVMRDPDAPGGNFIHWELRRIPASSLQLPSGRVPSGVVQGRNSFGTTGYRGPCPPRGAQAHHYVITVIALRGGKAIALGTVTGIYARR